MNANKRTQNHHIHFNKFKWDNIEDIWISQQDDWTCQLAALRIVLRFYHMDINEEELIQILKAEQFNIFDFGTYLPFIGVLALKFGLDITYRTEISDEYPHEKSIISSVSSVRKIILEDLQNVADEEPIKQGYNALLRILKLGGNVYFHQPYSPPSFKEMKNALKKGVVIALISAREYYGIDENWDHAIALIPSYRNSFIVMDDFIEKGYECYQHWEKYLNHAKKYEWVKWKGRMIEFEENL